jgi:hypothetical protein
MSELTKHPDRECSAIRPGLPTARCTSPHNEAEFHRIGYYVIRTADRERANGDIAAELDEESLDIATDELKLVSNMGVVYYTSRPFGLSDYTYSRWKPLEEKPGHGQ